MGLPEMWVSRGLVCGDLVVGVEQRLGEQGANVGSTEAVDDPTSVSPALDQSSEAEFGQMLTGDGGTATGDHSQRGYVSVVVSKRPQQSHPSGIGQQGEGHDRGRHLVLFKNVRVRGCGR
jgi:hypothetical protein